MFLLVRIICIFVGGIIGGIGGFYLAIGIGLLAVRIEGHPEVGSMTFFLASLITVPGGILLGAVFGGKI
ncbi:MAG: hypothetical protein QF886_27340, partial [Planctomycetota bacterium]|nr:hypothetical protein [Planctomycetota bacterium]